MKKLNLKTIACLSLSAIGAMSTVDAQTMCAFTRADDASPIQPSYFLGEHRAAPYFVDYNNDGLMDVFYGGQDCDGRAGEGASVWFEVANLSKNNGDGTFTRIEDSGLPLGTHQAARFFDYNNDGYIDVLLTGKGDYLVEKVPYTYLYKNLGPAGNYRFEEVLETGLRQGYCEDERFGNISTGDYNHDGLLDVLATGINDAGRYTELYKNNGNNTFSVQELKVKEEGVDTLANFLPVSGGSASFGDFDNDGWLDILVTGYKDTETGAIRIYRNDKDGFFHDVTPTDDLHGSNEGEVIWADFNSDGLLDLLVTGFENCENWNRVATIFYNDGTGHFSFADATSIGLEPANKTSIMAADINNDGALDLVYNGWGKDKGGHTYIYYQTGAEKFVLDETYPVVNTRDGGICIGDADNDNDIDIFAAGYSDGGVYACPALLFKNNLAEGVAVNTAPSVPTDLAATYADGKVSISWSASTDDITSADAISYNVYVKDNATNNVFMLFPSDIATGRLKTTKGSQVTIYPTSYEMTLAEGAYTIGVQSVDQGLLGSAFATTTLNTSGSSIDEVVAAASVTVVGKTIRIQSDVLTNVSVKDISGKVIRNAKSNETISGLASGLYFVTVNGKTTKVVL